MSLITLKNDSSQPPYNFRNYFRDPIILPPKSSVSLSSAVVYKGEELDTEDNEFLSVMIGDFDSELNPVYPVFLDESSWTPPLLAVELADKMNNAIGQCAFTDTTPGQRTFEFTYDATNKRMDILHTQQSLPAEGPSPLAWDGINLTNYLPTSNAGGFTRLRRSAVPIAGNQVAFSGYYNQSIIPRNGGYCVFKPRAVAGQYQFSQNMSIVSNAPGESGASFHTLNPTAPAGPLRITTYGPGPQARAKVELNIGVNRIGIEVADYEDAPGASAAIAMDGATQYWFCIDWDGPYSMRARYSTNYVGMTAPATTWTLMYSMKDDATTRQVPTYQDNFSPCVYMRDANAQMEIAGSYSKTPGVWDWGVAGIPRTSDSFEVKDSTPFSDTLTGVFPNQFLKKEIRILCDTEADDFFLEEDDWKGFDDYNQLYETQIGKILGWSDGTNASILMLDSPTAQNQITGFIPTGTVAGTNLLPTIHIQLTNLGIGSKNGVVSNNVKDIAVIPQFNDTEPLLPLLNRHLYYQSGYENKINLNNLQEITLNQIDCLLTYDNNREAVALEDFTTLIIKFHKGED